MKSNAPLWDRLESRQLFAAVPPPAAQLTAADVSTILAHAASQARSTQAVAVVDREGNVLGEYISPDLTAAGTDPTYAAEVELDAIARAKTAAFFESRGEAFTTRTARFIIQDHFPQPVVDTPGGPLYGVQYSSAFGTDVLPPAETAPLGSITPAGLSGDPGGLPLYVTPAGTSQRLPVGGVGVAGDLSDVAARNDLIETSAAAVYAHAANPKGKVFNGTESADFDESVALAGAAGYMPAPRIVATQILLDGLRLPFTDSPVATGHPQQTLAQLVAGGGQLAFPVVDAPADPYPVVTVGSYGQTGQFVRQDFRADPTAAGQVYTSVDSNDTTAGTTTADSNRLTAADVDGIIAAAVNQADVTRAGIRRPIGVHAVVQIAVVDTDGDLLGAFRMSDATMFSYDVAVQKARTAAFFSDDTHAVSTRAIGFVSQRYLPSGISNGIVGPLFGLQNALKFANVTTAADGTDLITDGPTSTPTPSQTAALKSIGTVAAAVADPLAAAVVVSGTTLTVGQIVTFGGDAEHEYQVTAVTAAGATLQLDGIDTPADPPTPLTAGEAVYPKNPLKDGITIFPGGLPLYRNGQLVGGIGVSGDGVDQDDVIAFAGTRNFRPAAAIRSDALPSTAIPDYLAGRVGTMEQTFNLGSSFDGNQDFEDDARKRLEAALVQQHVRLPYVKQPRNPHA